MTKKEIIEKLINELQYTEKSQKELEAMSKAELEKLLANLSKEKSSVTVAGEGNETGEVDASEDNKADSYTVLSEVKVQLGIFKEFVYAQRFKGSKIIVTNLGPGSVYAGDEFGALYGDKEQLIGRGKEKVFEGVKAVCLISSSQPEVKIVEVE